LPSTAPTPDQSPASTSGSSASRWATSNHRTELEGFGWHDLRHHHASLLLSRGISPALVAERLGHDIKTLLRTYAHVIRSDEDKVRAVVDETLGQTVEDWLRTEGVS
jgi:integrase